MTALNERLSIATDFQQDGECIAPELAAIASAGFCNVHWCQNWHGAPVFYSSAYIEQTRQLLEHHGLRLMDLHGYSGTARTGIRYTRELFLAVNHNRMEFARALGASVLVVHLPMHRCDEPQRGLADALNTLEAFEPLCRRHGVRLAVENLFDPPQGEEFAEKIFERFAPDYVGFCYDSGHALMLNRADYVSRFVGRLIATHLHDNDGASDWHVLPGEGKADWGLILKTLAQGGYAGPVTLEVGKPSEETPERFCARAKAAFVDLWEKHTR